jgi:hypothetical protein
MDTQLSRGSIAGVPYHRSAVNLESSDIPQIIEAATDLTRTVGNVALKVGAASIGMACAGALLSAMFDPCTGRSPFDDTSAAYIAMGNSPIYVATGGRSFWGIILDDTLAFSKDGQNIRVPFHLVRKIEMPTLSACGQFDCDDCRAESIVMNVQLIDGSGYYFVTHREPTDMRLATIAGVQTVSLLPQEQASGWFSGPKPYSIFPRAVKFQPARIDSLEALRERLRFVLRHNAQAISDLIGSDLLSTYFHYPPPAPAGVKPSGPAELNGR